MKEKEYIFFPVNNNTKLEREGGSHWSMFLYCSKEAHRGFYHHNPVYKSNFKHANELMGELSYADDFFRSKITEVNSPKQDNGYDCGIYVVMYASRITNDITIGKSPSNYNHFFLCNCIF